MKFFIQSLMLFMAVHVYAQHTAPKSAAKMTSSEWIDIAATKKTTAQAFVQNKSALQLTEHHTLNLISTRKSRNGYRQYHYQQTYKGVPIEGAMCIVHEKNAQVQKAKSSLANNVDVDIQATLSEDIALQIALDDISATRYAWEDEQYEAQLKTIKGANATFFPTANLVIFNPNIKSDYKNESYLLAYRFDIYALAPMQRAMVYVDAHAGTVLAVHDLMHFADIHVSGKSNYNDTIEFTADKTDNIYSYKSELGGGIKVLNSNNARSYPDNDITEPDAFFDQDPRAVDVLWASEKTYQYFRDIHQYEELDSMPIYSWIHYGEDFANAFWNGSWLTFGDGNGTTLLSPTSLDIVAHEITHIITNASSNLIYSSESGALNESFSDIFGEIIETIYRQEDGDWIAGGQTVAVPNLRGSRNLADPKDATMLNRQPDTYGGEFWYTGVADFGGVHTNSGVQNHWFYLLAFGGSGVNDNGYAYNVEGIGMEKAAQITFQNLINLFPYDGYAEARAGAIATAEMLYGADSEELRQTTAAWCAVGVGDCYEDDCNVLDSLALVELYDAANGYNWTNTWDFNSPVATWYGVTLNSSGCVSKLDISNNNLTADIAPEIGNLRHLKELYLNNNALTSIVPATIGNIDSLEILNLWGNIIGGALPAEIGHLENLRILNVSWNNIVSPIPDEIGNLSKLTELQLNFNPFSGAIPAVFGNLNSLNYLDLSNCNFTGTIPVELGNLINLTGLVLNNNRIGGTVPSELYNLQALELLVLNHNRFTFSGLELIAQMNLNDARYNPQDSTYILSDANGLYINSGATIANDTYTWYKDGALFATITGNNYLTINTPGRYRCEVVNSRITDASNLNTNFVLYTGELYAEPGNLSSCRQQDSLALVALYHATDGENWLSTWDLTDPIDLWTGVTMGPDGCVDIINLFGNNLVGTLPPEIGNLTHVREFNVSFNALHYVAPEIGNMTELTHLNLNVNNFNQNIPSEIGNLTNLQYLDISYNRFMGDVPASFSNLSQLDGLVLTDNKLSGTIPMSLFNLNYLYIDYNNFNFKGLEYWSQASLQEFRYAPQAYIPIYKNANTLSVNAGGTLDNNTYYWFKDYQLIDTTYGEEELVISEPGYYFCDIYNSMLTDLVLWSEEIEVFSVSDLSCRERDSLALVELYHTTNGANWTNIWDLNQPLNTWYGLELSNAGCVDKLDLRENNLDGTLPTAIGDLTEMRTLYLQGNQINGQIPYQIANLTNLEIIDLGDNSLSGNIPDEISNMTSLKRISLHWNQLSGTIPSSLWNKTDLEVIRLFKNHLTGTLPHTIGQLVNVRHFSIGNNGFTGTIPPEIGQMINLKRLSIYDCDITGNIPAEIANLSQLTELILHANELTGTIPPELGELENLVEVRLNKNKLSGLIPFDTNQLDELWIDRNHFTFDQIEDWVAAGANTDLDLFRYAPQAEIPLHTNGDTLYVEAGGTMANNNYHWYKDGVFQQTIQGDNKYLPTSTGSYHCTITNSIATDETIFYTRLILKTETVYAQPFVWPGDFNANGEVEISDVLYWGFAYGNQGLLRPNATTNWEAQAAPQWITGVSDANGKHQDADGNGEVNEQDLLVMTQNFGSTRDNAVHETNNFESPYILSMKEAEVIDNGNTITRKYDVLLNSTNGLAVSLHGIDFTLALGTSNSSIVNTVTVEAGNSFLAPDELVVIPNDDNTELRIAATRTDRSNRIGGGVILQVIVVSDDVSVNEPILHVLEPKDIEVMIINTGHEGSEAQLIPVSGETFSFMYTPECNTPSCEDEGTTYYFITNKKTGDRFYPASHDHNAPMLKANTGRNDDWVQWEKIPTTNGYFYLKNKATGKYIRPANDDDAATVWQVPTDFTGTYTQWMEVPAGGDFYYLQNRSTGKFIRPLNDTPDAPILQQPSTWTGDWTQWTIEAVPAPKLQTEDIAFNLYPNPAEDYIHIDIQDTWENARITIYDVSGKLLMQQAITSETQDISVENLKAGMYILGLNIDDGKYATKRFVVK